MKTEPGIWTKQKLTVILINLSSDRNRVYLNYFSAGNHQRAVLRNPGVLSGNMITGTELAINVYTLDSESGRIPEAELLINQEDFLPEAFCDMLGSSPPAMTTFFGLISSPEENRGRYYMLRDHNEDGLLLCTGTYIIKKGKGYCSGFDGRWPLRYNMIENFFYGFDRPECDTKKWKHTALKLKEIDESIMMKTLSRRFRDYAAGWHRYNFFYSDDWSLRFYRKQARLGFIAITHNEGGINRLVPQLQREYAVLDWGNIVIDRGVRRILESSRMTDERIRLEIDSDPETVIENLTAVWKDTWISSRYAELIKGLASKPFNGRGLRIWGVTLTAGDNRRIIAGELGYTIGRTYTSLSGFFHRGEKRYDNFGKLQMVMLAEVLQKKGAAFWNLGQPYMEYKIKLGAEVVPRGLFLKRWDSAVKGKTVDLKLS